MATQISLLAEGLGTLGEKDPTTGKRPIQVSGLITLEKLRQLATDHPQVKERTALVRNALAATGRKGDYEKLKGRLPAVIPSLSLPPGAGIRDLSDETIEKYHTERYGLDIDEQRETTDMAALREALISLPQTVAVGTSAGGDALYLIMAGPRARSYKEHVANWRAIAALLPEEARANSGKSSVNPQRLRFIAHDPDFYLAEDWTPWTAEELAAAPGGEQKPLRAAAPPAAPPAGDWIDSAIAHCKAALLPADGGTYNDHLAVLGAVLQLRGAAGLAAYQEGSRRPLKTPDQVDTLNGSPEPALWSIAARHGWKPPAGAPATTKGKMTVAERTRLERAALSQEAAQADPWSLVGGHFAREHMEGWRYHPDHGGWAEWNGRHWEFPPQNLARETVLDKATPVILGVVQSCIDEGVIPPLQGLGMLQGGWSASGSTFASFLSGVRNALRQAVPPRNRDYFPAANGCVRLADLTLVPHHPDLGMRAVARGNYYPKAAALEEHRAVLYQRFSPVLDDAEREVFFQWLGMVFTGQIQSYNGSFTVLTGKSGSGKGGVQKALHHALGDLYYTGSTKLFADERPSGHDTDRATLVQADPYIVGVDERGTGSVRMQADQVNLLTGDNRAGPYTKKGDNHQVVGYLHFAVLNTAISSPTIERGSGIERRLCAIQTSGQLGEGNKAAGGLSQELADALVSAGCSTAHWYLENGLQDVKGTPKARASALADMDEFTEHVGNLLNDRARWDGASREEMRDSFQDKDLYPDRRWGKKSTRQITTAILAWKWEIHKTRKNGIGGHYLGWTAEADAYRRSLEEE